MPLHPGDSAFLFSAESDKGPRFDFGQLAGRWVVMTFVRSSQGEAARAAIELILGRKGGFDDEHLTWCAVTGDRDDLGGGRAKSRPVGVRWFHDPAGEIGGPYFARDAEDQVIEHWLILDPTLRVLAMGPLAETATLVSMLDRLPPPGRHAGEDLTAPVLQLPRVFDPELCRTLIDLHQTQGGEATGFTQEIGGKTAVVMDTRRKVRKDCNVDDPALQARLAARIFRGLVPQIERSFQFAATRLERYLVGCYEAEEGGHFRAHRDNTTKGTAHRKFAVSINLNDDFDGGELRFPEFGDRTYRPPPGGAVAFSCGLLHEATRVTRGRRYAFLPFLYDEAGAALREANEVHLDDSLLELQARRRRQAEDWRRTQGGGSESDGG